MLFSIHQTANAEGVISRKGDDAVGLAAGADLAACRYFGIHRGGGPEVGLHAEVLIIAGGGVIVSCRKEAEPAFIGSAEGNPVVGSHQGRGFHRGVEFGQLSSIGEVPAVGADALVVAVGIGATRTQHGVKGIEFAVCGGVGSVGIGHHAIGDGRAAHVVFRTEVGLGPAVVVHTHCIIYIIVTVRTGLCRAFRPQDDNRLGEGDHRVGDGNRPGHFGSVASGEAEGRLIGGMGDGEFRSGERVGGEVIDVRGLQRAVGRYQFFAGMTDAALLLDGVVGSHTIDEHFHDAIAA